MPNLTVSSDVDTMMQAADKAGIKTAIGLGNITNTLHTASPNNTVNALQVEVEAGTTDADLVLTPKGAGALILGPEPDGTAVGGNKRGVGAVDLQTSRTAANQVAAGVNSVAIGRLNIASGTEAAAIGRENSVTGGGGAFGKYNSVLNGWCIGERHSAESSGSIAVGQWAKTYKTGQFAHAIDRFTFAGTTQFSRFILINKTTNNTPTELTVRFSIVDRLNIPSGQIHSCLINVVGIKSDGNAVARYLRTCIIKNVAGTTSLVGTVETIGTDHEDAATDLSITADDTNDALKIEVTGITGETWRWLAIVEAADLTYGT